MPLVSHDVSRGSCAGRISGIVSGQAHCPPGPCQQNYLRHFHASPGHVHCQARQKDKRRLKQGSIGLRSIFPSPSDSPLRIIRFAVPKWCKLLIAILLLPVCVGAASALWLVFRATGSADTTWVPVLA